MQQTFFNNHTFERYFCRIHHQKSPPFPNFHFKLPLFLLMSSSVSSESSSSSSLSFIYIFRVHTTHHLTLNFIGKLSPYSWFQQKIMYPPLYLLLLLKRNKIIKLNWRYISLFNFSSSIFPLSPTTSFPLSSCKCYFVVNFNEKLSHIISHMKLITKAYPWILKRVEWNFFHHDLMENVSFL